MTVVSNVDIANLALDLLGETPIVSLDDNNKAARLCKRQIDPRREALLRSYRWNFAIGRVILAPDSTIPVFGYDNRFLLPSDFLMMIGVFDDNQPKFNYTSGYIDHVVEDGYIHADETELCITYIKDITDPTKFDPLFVDLMSVDIAQRISFGLTTGNKRSADLTALRRDVLRQARISDAIEGTAEVITADEWLTAHDSFRATGLRNRNAI